MNAILLQSCSGYRRSKSNATISSPIYSRLSVTGSEIVFTSSAERRSPARTLPNGRLSEDIDLVALGNRKVLAEELDAVLPRAVQRTHGRLEWAPALSSVADTEAANLRTAGGISVKVQLLASGNRTMWPAEVRTLEQRYADAPPSELIVPTLPAFAASKTATWHDRRASRDLWDLWSLNTVGAIDSAAGSLYRKLGPTNRLPVPHLFDRPPNEHDWNSQLAGQTRLTVTAMAALNTVREAWVRVSQDQTMLEDR